MMPLHRSNPEKIGCLHSGLELDDFNSGSALNREVSGSMTPRFDVGEEDDGRAESALSVLSWGDDELERDASRRLQLALDDVEALLYGNTCSESVPATVVDECRQWRKRFPYLRLVGKKAEIHADVPEVESVVNQVSRLTLNGIENEPREPQLDDEQVEEVLVQHGFCEPPRSPPVPVRSSARPSALLAEMVTNSLVSLLWTEYVTAVAPVVQLAVGGSSSSSTGTLLPAAGEGGDARVVLTSGESSSSVQRRSSSILPSVHAPVRRGPVLAPAAVVRRPAHAPVVSHSAVRHVHASVHAPAVSALRPVVPAVHASARRATHPVLQRPGRASGRAAHQKSSRTAVDVVYDRVDPPTRGSTRTIRGRGAQRSSTAAASSSRTLPGMVTSLIPRSLGNSARDVNSRNVGVFPSISAKAAANVYSGVHPWSRHVGPQTPRLRLPSRKSTNVAALATRSESNVVGSNLGRSILSSSARHLPPPTVSCRQRRQIQPAELLTRP